MIKVISKYTFLLRSGEKRESVQTGQAIEVTDEELKKFRDKFILYSEVTESEITDSKTKSSTKKPSSK